jgi:hypothetical protein
VFGIAGGWEAFDVTEVVRAWVRKGRRGAGASAAAREVAIKKSNVSDSEVSGRKGADIAESTSGDVSGHGGITGGPGVDGIYVLDVSIDSVFVQSDIPRQAIDELTGDATAAPLFRAVDIDVDPENDRGPLLVVFSKDVSGPTRPKSRTSYRFQQRKHDLQDFINHEPATDAAAAAEENRQSSSSLLGHVSQAGNTLARTSKVSFSLKNVTKSDNSRELFLPRDVPYTGEHQEAATRLRRDANKKKRNSCRRRAMYVDFQEINWHQWIIAPPGYMVRVSFCSHIHSKMPLLVYILCLSSSVIQKNPLNPLSRYLPNFYLIFFPWSDGVVEGFETLHYEKNQCN